MFEGLTIIISGAKNCRHIPKNGFNLLPIIWYMQSLNRSIPKNQEIAIVWKKQTHSSDKPDAA